MFICWISQIVAMLDSEHGHAVHHIVQDIAKSYPMALVYPFKISQESYTFASAGGNEAIARRFVQGYVSYAQTTLL